MSEPPTGEEGEQREGDQYGDDETTSVLVGWQPRRSDSVKGGIY